MLNRFLCALLALIFTVFVSPQTVQAESARRVVVFAIDYSDSMHGAPPHLSHSSRPSHLLIFTSALEAALNGPLASCQSLRIDYLMWGTSPEPVISVNLDDTEERESFTRRLWQDLYHVNLTGTDHLQGWAKAVTEASRSNAEVTAILFVTDQTGGVVAIRPPEDTVVYKVAIDASGGDSVRTYLETKMAADFGEVFGTTTADELQTVLERIFAEIGTNLCIG